MGGLVATADTLAKFVAITRIPEDVDTLTDMRSGALTERTMGLLRAAARNNGEKGRDAVTALFCTELPESVWPGRTGLGKMINSSTAPDLAYCIGHLRMEQRAACLSLDRVIEELSNHASTETTDLLMELEPRLLADVLTEDVVIALAKKEWLRPRLTQLIRSLPDDRRRAIEQASRVTRVLGEFSGARPGTP
jgi:hypothetical protein